MLSDRSYQVRALYWLWRAGYMDRRTALGLLRCCRQPQGAKVIYPIAGNPGS